MHWPIPLSRFHVKLGKRIEALRTERGMSRQDLSLRLTAHHKKASTNGVRWLKRIEHGHVDCTILTFRRIAEALGITPAQLLALPGDPLSEAVEVVRNMSEEQAHRELQRIKGLKDDDSPPDGQSGPKE